MQFRSFQRPNYFDGKLLSAEDFRHEQEYHREKARLRNRFLFGWGIVSGLHVSIEQTNLIVSPGLGLDSAGNELVLSKEERISLSNLTGHHFVTIRYIENPVNLIPSVNGELVPAYIEESVTIEVSHCYPLASHGSIKQEAHGSDHAHALCLARINQKGSRWRVTNIKDSLLRRR